MSEWWTYAPSDFLMFLPQAYWRLVERYQEWLGPARLAGPVAGLALVLLLRSRKPAAQRAALALLAMAWLWCGIAFHAMHYAEIFLAAPAFAAGCSLQAGLLLVACGVLRRGAPSTEGIAGRLLLAAGALFYPLEGILAGRPASQAEAFALMPDPTALATLGALLVLPLARWQKVALAVLPALSLAAGWTTRWLLAQ
jgi:hypothetical protein